MRTQARRFVEADDVWQANSITGLELVKAKGAIEQFIYSCSHTLRAPLKSIAGLVNLLKNSKDNDEIDPKLFLESIEKTVEKMESLLNELEQFLSNSRQTIVMQPIDAKEILQEALNEFQTKVRSKNIKITSTVQQSVPFHTDKSRLQVILSHVVSNAVHFQDVTKSKMQITIRIRITRQSCKIQIRDNGIGINEDVLPNIFQLFYRGSVQSLGSGVGLYITREILVKMNGAIAVRSTEGKGSTFNIMIPNLKL